jgi:hypothetical protein
MLKYIISGMYIFISANQANFVRQFTNKRRNLFNKLNWLVENGDMSAFQPLVALLYATNRSTYNPRLEMTMK